jgi:Tol biopolymer transport system component
VDGRNAARWARQAARYGQQRRRRLEVFYVGTNDQLYHRVQLTTGGWSQEIAFSLDARDLAVSRNSNGRLELFYAAPTGAILHTWQLAPNSNWSGGSGL